MIKDKEGMKDLAKILIGFIFVATVIALAMKFG